MITHFTCIVLSLLAITSRAQSIPPCINALSEADKNGDGKIVRSEFLTLLPEVSPYEQCPDMNNIFNFYGDGTYSQLFISLACLCRTYETNNENCCTDSQYLTVPGVYDGSYPTAICQAIFEAIDNECKGKADLKPTTSPTTTPTTMPSTLSSTLSPTLLSTTVKVSPFTQSPTITSDASKVDLTYNQRYQDSNKSREIFIPLIAAFGILSLVVLLLIRKGYRNSGEGRLRGPSTKVGKLQANNEDMTEEPTEHSIAGDIEEKSMEEPSPIPPITKESALLEAPPPGSPQRMSYVLSNLQLEEDHGTVSEVSSIEVYDDEELAGSSEDELPPRKVQRISFIPKPSNDHRPLEFDEEDVDTQDTRKWLDIHGHFMM